MVHKEFMNKRQLKAYERMESDVDLLNSIFFVGEHVHVTNDFGEIEYDSIKYPFSIMSGSVVAWLNKKGSYIADRVSKIG